MYLIYRDQTKHNSWRVSNLIGLGFLLMKGRWNGSPPGGVANVSRAGSNDPTEFQFFFKIYTYFFFKQHLYVTNFIFDLA